MSASPDWLLPARSIPVEVGFHVVLDDGRAGICVSLVDPEALYEEIGVVYPGGNDVMGENPGNVVIDLSNPDTFAAARDRLAARMGLDPDLIADGVLFGPAQPGGKWLIGGLLGLRLTWTTTDVYANTRELALALAWQKVVGS